MLPKPRAEESGREAQGFASRGALRGGDNGADDRTGEKEDDRRSAGGGERVLAVSGTYLDRAQSPFCEPQWNSKMPQKMRRVRTATPRRSCTIGREINLEANGTNHIVPEI